MHAYDDGEVEVGQREGDENEIWRWSESESEGEDECEESDEVSREMGVAWFDVV